MDKSNLDNREQGNNEAKSSSSSSPVTKDTKTFSHKYKWSGQEIGIIITLLLGLGLSFVGYSKNQFEIRVLITIVVLVVIILAYLLQIGFSRKKKSRLLATYDVKTTELVVEGNGYTAKANRGLLRKVVSASTKRIGINDTLVLHIKNAAAIYVPARVAADPGFYEILEELLVRQTTISTKNPDVIEFLEQAKNYKR